MWYIAIGGCKVEDLYKVLIECILTTTKIQTFIFYIYYMTSIRIKNKNYKKKELKKKRKKKKKEKMGGV